MKPLKTKLIYATASSREEALCIGRRLVEEKLAACVNLFPAMHSVYRWKGEVQEADEAVLLAKTTEPCVRAAIDRIRELHSYDCPCVVSWPIENGNPAFLEWIRCETIGSDTQ